MGTKRTFTAEYKKEIAKLILEKGMSQKEISKDINVHVNTLNNWVRKYKEEGEEAFPGKGKLSPQDQEVYELKKKMKDLEEENEILKKAMTFFVKPQK